VSNLKIILKMYDYFGSGRLDLISSELLDPEIVWRVPGHHPLAGAHRGRIEALAFIGGIVASGIVFTDSHYGELDDGTVVERHLGRATLDGLPIELPTVTTYGFAGERIADVQVHPANQHDLDRYLWAVTALKPVSERLVSSPTPPSSRSTS
jgi:ketosteroid isomerase-like protein